MPIDKRVEDACEEVDAMVFSGDGLYNQESLDLFKTYLGRWQRKVPELQEIIEEINEELNAPQSENE